MAQYAYRAANYPLNTSLTDLGFVAHNVSNPLVLIPIVNDRNGVKVFDMNGLMFSLRNAGFYSTDIPETGDYEVLMLCRVPFSDTVNDRIQMGGLGRFDGTSFYGVGYSFKNASTVIFEKYQMVGATTSSTFQTVTTNTTLNPSYDLTVGMGVRVKVTGTTIQSRFWTALPANLESSEPGTWDFVATDATLSSPGRIGISLRESKGVLSFTDLSFGTGGDSAPYPDPNQAVTTPTGLAVSNITATTADADWT